MATAKVRNLWGTTFGLFFDPPETALGLEQWIALLGQTIAFENLNGASQLIHRLVVGNQSEKLREALQHYGFQKRSGRVEFQIDLAKLPDDAGSPFIWKSQREMGWSDLEVANLLSEVAKEAPDFDPSEDPLEAFRGFMNDQNLTRGPECVAVGLIEGAPCALVIAQINRKTGWSRITYMGIVPSWRGKQLGQWVHRKGFMMMKAQGGRTYHGGTLVENGPMKRLFELHQCSLLHYLEEWVFNVSGSRDETKKC